MGNLGKMVSTMNIDGTVTTQMTARCFSCNGFGVCQVCSGTGGQYWYQIGIMPCGACGGSGRCHGCLGKGYTITSTHKAQSGVVIGWDEHGNNYVAARDPHSHTKSSEPRIFDCCLGVLAFGLDPLYHKCNNCEELHWIRGHKCIKE